MGFTFGFGAPMGYAAGAGRVDWPWAMLYATAILWDLGFDTIYAHQDREDDAIAGVRSTARLMGERTRPFPARLLRGHHRGPGGVRLAGWAVRVVFRGTSTARRMFAVAGDSARHPRPGGVSPVVSPEPGDRIGHRPGNPVGPYLTAAFIAAHTVLARAPLVPEIVLHLATEITPIWLATEAFLDLHNIEPPFWAFAWPGSQAMARYVLDNPASVRGRRVLDFAAGGGLAAVACAMAGAASVEAVEIDPVASTAARMNAAMNGVNITVTTGDLVGVKCQWDLILCGDVCYQAPMVNHIVPWLRRMAAVAEVWIADPGRAYLPGGLEAFARYDVPTTKELEDTDMRRTTLHRLSAS